MNAADRSIAGSGPFSVAPAYAMVDGLGTFGGMFTPSNLTILGVIMWLRLGWVVGSVGIPATVLIIKASTFITALSVATIATDRLVRIGGACYMISRSLGMRDRPAAVHGACVLRGPLHDRLRGERCGRLSPTRAAHDCVRRTL